MATWIVGDIHGCASELGELLERIALGSSDRLLCLGDLFQRGPDALGVVDLLRQARASFLLGNHEHCMLKRNALSPQGIQALPRPVPHGAQEPLGEHALDGDGGVALPLPPRQRRLVLDFLQEHAGYYAQSTCFAGAGPTADGRPWCAVHAGLIPGQALSDSSPEELVSLRRLDAPGRPFWYELYHGPTLVLFGHTPGLIPRAHHHQGRLVALGLDTGCVYGGRLSAYSPELDRLVSVPARRAYAQRR